MKRIVLLLVCVVCLYGYAEEKKYPNVLVYEVTKVYDGDTIKALDRRAAYHRSLLLHVVTCLTNSRPCVYDRIMARSRSTLRRPQRLLPPDLVARTP